MADRVLAELAALKSSSFGELRAKWRNLFESEPPAYNRKFIESRLVYRVQELAHGGLRRDTVERLEALADELEGKGAGKRRNGAGRPTVGTRLIREWQGSEHVVTVTTDGFEYAGRPFKSLSAIARTITGTQWNGPLFFGLRNHRGKA